MSAGISVMAEYKGKSFTVYFTESRSYEEMEKVVRNGLRLLYYDRPIKLYEFMGRNT